MTEAQKKSEFANLAQARIPTYDISHSFEWNIEHGPRFDGPDPALSEPPLKPFLGFSVRSRFGIAASILFNSRWVAVYSRLGFDLLTYKTVRSRPRACHPYPNWVFLEEGPLAELARPEAPQRLATVAGQNPLAAGAAGSFGMPSTAPDFWKADIARSKSLMAPHQVLIVSVVATVEEDTTEASIIEEFASLARAVKEAGADIVEINLSCPNVGKAEGKVYLDPRLSGAITAEASAAVGETPLLVKIGHIEDPKRFADLLHALDGTASGVVLINGISRAITNADGGPAFGRGRERAGIIGPAIAEIARELVREARVIVERDGLGLALVGLGGVSSEADARSMMAAGADAVQCASAAVWHPYLAAEIKGTFPEL